MSKRVPIPVNRHRNFDEQTTMTRRTATFALMTLFCCIAAHGESDGDEKQLAVDGERAKTYVGYLCSDAMEGRASCTEGYRRAAD